MRQEIKSGHDGDDPAPPELWRVPSLACPPELFYLPSSQCPGGVVSEASDSTRPTLLLLPVPASVCLLVGGSGRASQSHVGPSK